MKHKNGFNPLSRTASHRKAMHRNMVTSLFRHERVTTTKPKALEVRRTAEKLITRSKVDTVHNRRQVARYIFDEAVLSRLFTEIGPRMKDRNGGYTRVLKLGFREGDAAEVAILELVDYKLQISEKSSDKEKKSPVKADAEKKKVPSKVSATKKESAVKKDSTSKKEPAPKKPVTVKKPAEQSVQAAPAD